MRSKDPEQREPTTREHDHDSTSSEGTIPQLRE
jgi:hypothetical protein